MFANVSVMFVEVPWMMEAVDNDLALLLSSILFHLIREN
jgi:hypothetical protein